MLLGTAAVTCCVVAASGFVLVCDESAGGGGAPRVVWATVGGMGRLVSGSDMPVWCDVSRTMLEQQFIDNS